jgi:hypothetical protein
LELVRSRRFDAKSKRHRAKLLTETAFWISRESEFVTPLDVALAEIQERYRRAHGTLDRSYTSTAARRFQLALQRLDENGEPTAEAAEAIRVAGPSQGA